MKQTLTLTQLHEVIANLSASIDELKCRSLMSRRITHQGHLDKHFIKSIDTLETELVAQRALAKRIEIVGR